MLRGIEKSAASPLFSSTLSTTSVSVRRLQRPGSGVGADEQQVESTVQERAGRGVGVGVGDGVGVGVARRARHLEQASASAVGARLADGDAVAAGSSPNPSSSSSGRGEDGVDRVADRQDLDPDEHVRRHRSPTAGSRGRPCERSERGTFEPTCHQASTMATDRQTKRTPSATTMPSRTVGWSRIPTASPGSPPANETPANAATTTGTRKSAPMAGRPVRYWPVPGIRNEKNAAAVREALQRPGRYRFRILFRIFVHDGHVLWEGHVVLRTASASCRADRADYARSTSSAQTAGGSGPGNRTTRPIGRVCWSAMLVAGKGFEPLTFGL